MNDQDISHGDVEGCLGVPQSDGNGARLVRQSDAPLLQAPSRCGLRDFGRPPSDARGLLSQRHLPNLRWVK